MMYKLELKLKEYEDQFGEAFVFCFGEMLSNDEAIKTIEGCLKTKKKQVRKEYEESLDY